MKRVFKGCLWVTGLILLTACLQRIVEPPMAQQIEKKVEVFGDTRVDYYDWLKDKSDSNVIAYLEAENAYADYILKDTKGLQKKLYKEMIKRIPETDISVPVKYDTYYYYYRHEKGKQYPIYCRKKASLENPEEEVYFDANTRAQESNFYALNLLTITPNHEILAFSEDRKGNEVYTLRFKDLQDDTFYPEVIDSVASGVWSTDNKTFYYSTVDYTYRPWRVYKHVLGTSPSEDVLLFEEPEMAFYVDISQSKDKQYLFVTSASSITSEVFFLKMSISNSPLTCFSPREESVEYYLEHHDGFFYIHTNRGNQKNFVILCQPVSSPAFTDILSIYGHNREAKITGFEVFKDFLAVYRTGNARAMIDIYSFKDKQAYTINFPEETYTAQGTGNPMFDTEKLRIYYTSLLTPETIYDYDIETKTLNILKQKEVKGGWNQENYETSLLWVKARDGAEIPVSVVYKKGFKKDGSHPLYLYGYGSYGMTMTPYFSYVRWSLIDRGFVYAIAHIRGGGARGEYWYEEGKLLKKKNTFTDFIDVAEYFIREKYTIPEKLVISGGSAGGLLMGSVINMRPDLFGIVVASVPFVDVLNTMSDPTLPLTVIEYDEWGNPGIEEYYYYIKSYCPYTNVEAKAYPSMMITAGLNDSRVSYAEPAKWTAKLRGMKTDKNPLILRTNMGAGHGGASGRYDAYKEIAEEYAFILGVISGDLKNEDNQF
ncbi:MAG: S9 family peptidase [Candidatus Marinimicrobia bacterium]|nr:S9 family peptidase [Candidatus Neomarinimicrobiota bacterium]MDD5582722.1 S9 family peptidase [Candidatus Neomarinimicrobiota bacterium]